MKEQLIKWAKKLKLELMVLYLAYKDPRVPVYAKVFTLCLVAYAFSPIDLIPDFIPVLGYLDDLIVIPVGIMLALKMIPDQVLQEYRLLAEEKLKEPKPKSWFAGVIFVIIWILGSAAILIYLYDFLA